MAERDSACTSCDRSGPVPFNCPFCDECLWVEGAGWEHPHSETCPLDHLYIEPRHVAVWNSVARKAGTNG